MKMDLITLYKYKYNISKGDHFENNKINNMFKVESKI